MTSERDSEVSTIYDRRTRKDEDWGAIIAAEADHRNIEVELTYRSNS